MDVSDQDPYPLHTASRKSEQARVESLISADPKLVLKVDEDDRLPLHWACTQTNKEIVEDLIAATPRSKLDSIIDAQDASGWTPLMIASSLKENAGLPVIELLLRRDAEVKTQSNNGGTALHFATSKNNLDVVRKLLDSGASARVKDKRGQLALHRAAAVGNTPITRLLLGQGKSPINTTDMDGMTALHQAISEGHGDVALELLKAGADSTKKDVDERLPMDCAPDKNVKMFILRRAEMEGIDVEEGRG